MRFYLGTIEPHWLTRAERPLFVSYRRLSRRPLPKSPAAVPWALDSGGFTELSHLGEWQTTPAEYVDAARLYRDQLGRLEWAAPQDWMCEPPILEQTGLTVADHQQRTVENFLHLTDLAPDLPFIPVLQGWTLGDYLECVDLYTAAGVNLLEYPTVGLGSVCRRQATGEIDAIVSRIHAELGPRLHGFGVKTSGLRLYGTYLASADSMAWSYAGRKRPDPTHPHRTCAHCYRYAMAWADRIDRQPSHLRLAV